MLGAGAKSIGNVRFFVESLIRQFYPGINYSDEDVKARYVAQHGDEENFSEGDVQFYRDKYSDPVELFHTKSSH